MRAMLRTPGSLRGQRCTTREKSPQRSPHIRTSPSAVSAIECIPPQDTSFTLMPCSTGRGTTMSRSLASTPHCPYSLPPQEYTWPRSSTHALCQPPSAACVMRTPCRPSFTGQGLGTLLSRCPSPSVPRAFQPHANSLPSAPMASVPRLPVTRGSTPKARPRSRVPSSDSTTFGLLWSLRESSPSWLSSFTPHAKTTASMGGSCA
mmetsp:Transcript_12525/g.31593  ORF Transcript_12525/g.31593 Transcript_12525/m.31593 type:complete len:205 (+) Transcript_12525:40-654(+)